MVRIGYIKHIGNNSDFFEGNIGVAVTVKKI